MKLRPLALSALVVGLLAGCEQAEQTIIAQPVASGTVERFSDIELNGPMVQAFQDLRDFVDPFAAFYVTETGGGGGRIGGQPSLEAAKAGALAQCQEFNPGRTCILYATKVP